MNRTTWYVVNYVDRFTVQISGSHGKKHKKDMSGSSSSSEEKAVDPAAPDTPGTIKIGKKITRNLVAVLMAIADAVGQVHPKITQAAHELIRGISDDIFGVAEAFAYVPEFLLMEAPNQFIESLKFIVEHRKKLTKKGKFNLKEAVKVLEAWVAKVMETGAQAGMNFVSLWTFWPSVLKNFKQFYRAAVDGIFKPLEV